MLFRSNDACLLPGQIEAQGAALSKKHNGLIFTAAEIEEFKQMAAEANVPFDTLQLVEIEL